MPTRFHTASFLIVMSQSAVSAIRRSIASGSGGFRPTLLAFSPGAALATVAGARAPWSKFIECHPLAATAPFCTTSITSAKSPPGRGKKALKRLRSLRRSGRTEAELRLTEQVTQKIDESMSLEEAAHILKAVEITRPLSAYELHIVTTVSSHQSNALRGRISLPRDARTKAERILVFAEDGSDAEAVAKTWAALGPNWDASDEHKGSATDGGTLSTGTRPHTHPLSQDFSAPSGPAVFVGGSELINDVASNRVTGFTKVLCTPTLLGAVSKALARSLGPRGLMPSAKRGTVAEGSAAMEVALEAARGAMDWRGDRNGVVRGAVGRVHFPVLDLRRNVEALVDAVVHRATTGLGGGNSSNNKEAQAAAAATGPPVRAAVGKGREVAAKKAHTIIKQIHLSSTQGPGVELRLADIL